jgi:hypothetical protein
MKISVLYGPPLHKGFVAGVRGNSSLIFAQFLYGFASDAGNVDVIEAKHSGAVVSLRSLALGLIPLYCPNAFFVNPESLPGKYTLQGTRPNPKE